MYLKYFNLKSKPFEISPDPRFLWQGEKHKEGLATLRYSILTGKGFMSLTGDVGTGKTTLLNALAESFDDNFIFARIPDPSLETLDFLNFAANAFAMDKQFRSKGNFLSDLTTFLNSAHEDNKEVILIVDEAQRIKQELLEDIRLISNIEKPEKKLINIIFAGQNDFIYSLNNNKALRNRISINYQIEPLTENDTEKYITHRLQIAGSKSRIFNSSAIHEIYSFSKGNPRQTNIICDLALLHGYTDETKTIGPAIIKECAKRTLIPFLEPEPLAEFQTNHAQLPVKLNQGRPSRDLSRSWSRIFHRIKSTFMRPKAAYLAPVPMIIIIGLIGFKYYPANFNSSISKLKNYVVQVMNRSVHPIDDATMQNAQVVNAPTSLPFDPEPKALAKNLKNENKTNSSLTEELSTQAATIADLQNRLEAARAEQTKFKNALSLKDRVLIQSEQRRQELEMELQQAKSVKDQLDNELSDLSVLVADFRNKQKAFRDEQTSLEAQLQKSRQETVRAQKKLSQLSTQKFAAETRLEDLQTAHDALAADNERLRTTKTQVAELKNALAVKERMLAQGALRQQELEEDIKQAKSGKVQLGSELSSQGALVADLQNKLQSSRGEQDSLEAQLQKSRQETVLVQTQLSQLSTQKTAAETRLENLQTAHNVLAAELEALKPTKAQVAELKSGLSAKERILTQSEQRQQELEKELAQAKSGKVQLGSELSSQGALVADLQNKLQTSRGEQDALEAQLQKSRQETALVQTQLSQLSTQKTIAQTRLENLQTAHNVLAADFEALKTTKAQVAEFKNELSAKERILTQSEQRQQELEKELALAKSGKKQLDGELSSQGALVAGLQNKLQASRGEQDSLEAQLQKSREETRLLETQLMDLKAKTLIKLAKPADIESQKKSRSDNEAESPDPANIIDYVLKKKSK